MNPGNRAAPYLREQIEGQQEQADNRKVAGAMQNNTPQPDTQATKAPKPRLYHLWAVKTEEALHTYCGRVQIRSRSKTYTRPEVEASDLIECKNCADMHRLENQLKAEQSVLTEAALKLMRLQELENPND